jgi:hypothetical protein
MRFWLEHQLPRRLRYAKVYLEAGSASVSFSLDGTSADWRASIGRKGREEQLTDREYTRLRARIPATETMGDDGRMFVVRNAMGREESWLRPRWTLVRVRGARPGEDGTD